MGQPKQLLPIEGLPLLVRSVQAALSSPAWPIVVVLGHAAETIRPWLSRLPVQIGLNPEWGQGIGSSIAVGIEILDRFSSALDGALIALGDQPHLSSSAIHALNSALTGRQGISAARYLGVVGAPVIFGRAYFQELLTLPPSAGAQRVLQAHAEAVQPVDLPEFAVDLDTPEDYQKFLSAAPWL